MTHYLAEPDPDRTGPPPITLRPTTEADLPFVLAAEAHPDNRSFILQWTPDKHRALIASEDGAHLLITAGENGPPIGYAILTGLTDPADAIYLRRIVVTEKGRGFGRQALRLLKRWAFEERGAHRLWLDVLERNTRARHLYESEGFRVEGLLRDALLLEGRRESLVLMAILRKEHEGLS